MIAVRGTNMLEFSLGVVAADVFMGLGLEGITAEGEKRKIKTEENGLRAEEMLWKKERKPWNRKRPRARFLKTFLPCFRWILVCYLSNLGFCLEAQFTCHPNHTHTHCSACQLAFCVIHEILLYTLCICICRRIMQTAEKNSIVDLIFHWIRCVLQFPCL